MNIKPRFNDAKGAHPVARLRRELDMTQHEFARALGVSLNRPSRWELGREAMGPQTVLTLFKRYKKKLAKLVIDPLDLLKG